METGMRERDLHSASIWPTRIPVVGDALFVQCNVDNWGSRGWILGRNPDKSLKSFTPSYTQSPLQLCLKISISSNSRNLLQFLELLYITKKNGEKPDRKPYPLTCGLRNPYRNLKSEKTLKIMPRNLNDIVRSWIRLFQEGISICGGEEYLLAIRLVGSNSAFSKQLIMTQQRKVQDVPVVNGRW
jgi:hypothetical protein